jgi:hypothetical protein
VLDSQMNPVADGQEVRYHGSLSSQHGPWTFGGYCCDRCMPAGENLAEARAVLYRFSEGRKLEHVSASSFTAVPGPEAGQHAGAHAEPEAEAGT